jgi:hypothetical protein
MKRTILTLVLLGTANFIACGGEKTIVSLRDFCKTELKSVGLEIDRSTTVHIKALGGGGNRGWTYKSDRMFAYAWVIDADTRDLVWKMTVRNTDQDGEDRVFDGDVQLGRGSYELYYSVYGFEFHSTFKHVVVNIDHRTDHLFGGGYTEAKKGFFSWFSEWWSDELEDDWTNRCKNWGIDVLVDEDSRTVVKTFTAPKRNPNSLFRAVGLGDDEVVREGFSLSERTTLNIYALGEGQKKSEYVDYGWIVDRNDRFRVWEMKPSNVRHAGGAKKNIRYDGRVTLDAGDYVLYYITDDSHSAADWNNQPPYDPLNYGITLSARSERDRGRFGSSPYEEIENVIVSLTKVGDSEYLSEGFSLKQDAKVRIYAFGERGYSHRRMADYGIILDARTRKKVWSMDPNKTAYAGGASKNRLFDEVVHLRKGSYIVTYTTDDSHAYDSWNAQKPFDPEHYGITVMGTGPNFNPAVVLRFVEERDKSVLAQLVRVKNNANLRERFDLSRTTRVRIYAIGEGANRQMYDHAWIENAETGAILWEMTYGMTFHAGGGRKNRTVNTTIMLEKGKYHLRYRSDDSHSYGKWNVHEPEDPEYWGVTLYRDEALEAPPAPEAPAAPRAPPRGL